MLCISMDKKEWKTQGMEEVEWARNEQQQQILSSFQSFF